MNKQQPTIANTLLLLVLLVVGIGLWQQIKEGGHTHDTGHHNNTHAEEEHEHFHALVTNVIDGDTVEVRLEDDTRERVRLIGIDAPEIDWENFEDTECYAFEAKQLLTKLVKGREVELVLDPVQGRRDAYDRLLAFLTDIETGENINRMMLDEGAAMELIIGTPHTNYTAFHDAYRSAYDEKKGMWTVCN